MILQEEEYIKETRTKASGTQTRGLCPDCDRKHIIDWDRDLPSWCKSCAKKRKYTPFPIKPDTDKPESSDKIPSCKIA